VIHNLKPDEEVAILPTMAAPACAVLEIARVANADRQHLHLHDGRMFAIDSGLGLNTSGCVVRVTSEHRKVLKMFTDEQSRRSA
jgi:hypothetical protein